jgi:DNA-binding NarL/FixJ family response regulator
MHIRVAIVEDDAEIRKLTAGLLNFYPDIECIGAFGSAEEFLPGLPALHPDVVLMDIGLPGQSGIECVRACSDSYREVEFIMFTDHTDSREVFEALASGANGYVLKGGTPERLAAAIREVAEGGSPMSRQISRMVVKALQQAEQKHPDLEKLTPQEWEVLQCLDKGWAYKEIAAHRVVSEHTVRTQVRSIYQKLQVHTRTEALNLLHGRGGVKSKK